MSLDANGPASRRRLLLASDDLMFPSRVREAVRALDYDVVTAGTAQAVVEAAGSAVPAVILVNLNARHFDGPELIRALKADAATATVPLLAFAGHVEAAKHAAAREAGADMVAANSSVSLHLPKLLERLLAGERSSDIGDDHD